MNRGRSASPSRMRGRSGSPSRMRGRSGSPSRGMARGRSGSPSRLRGRSNSPSRGMAGGRSNSPSRGMARGRSNSPSRGMARGRSNSPSRGMARGRSNSPSRGMARGRSNSPSRGMARGRSNSPSRGMARGRSNSPSRMARGRSNSPSRQQPRGRSTSPGGRSRGASVSPSEQRARGGRMSRFVPRRGGKRRARSEGDGTPKRKSRLHPKRLVKQVHPKRLKKTKKKINKKFRQIAPKEQCPCWKIMSYVIPIIIMLCCAAGLITATGNAAKFTPDFIQNLIPAFDNNKLVDPNASGGGGGGGGGLGGSTSVHKWNNGDANNGLQLDVLNAMSAKWDLIFSVVMSDWDYGNPDSITLNLEKIAEDPDCTAVDGKLKICNGDYGETNWRGINICTYDAGGFIIASAARMNEYYLANDVDDAKQYTLCHETGHGFGLAHTDEEFGNPDLGNCLDYTDNFDVNMHPDESLYEALLALYGPVGGRRRGLLRNSKSGSMSSSPLSRPHNETLWQHMHEAVQKLAFRLDDNAHEGWKLLHRTRHGEEHEREFEGGYKVRVHMLLANEE